MKMMETIKAIIGENLKGSRKVVNLLTLGITVRQWAACLMICAMLSPVFALPARTAISITDLDPGSQSAGQYGPVNEPVPFWKEMLLDINANAAWLTPPRTIKPDYGASDEAVADEKNKSKNESPSPREILEKSVKTIDVKISNQKKIKVGQAIFLTAVLKDYKGKAVDKRLPPGANR
jgi:hypothetical protein